MSYIYAIERKKFDEEWSETAKYYADNGMSQASIAILHDDALEEFNARRSFIAHNQTLTPRDEHDTALGVRRETLLIKRMIECFSTEYDTGAEHSRYWWVEEINCEAVVDYLRTLTDCELEVLTLHIYEHYSAADIAQMLDIKYRTLARHIADMKSKIKNLYLANLTKSSFKQDA